MHKIINRTNSPYDLQGIDGSVRLPAQAEVVAKFAPEYIDILRAGGMVGVEEADAPSMGLRERYEALAGRPADKRWNDKRVAGEIEKLEAENANHIPQ